ncbi:MAG: cytochrome c biogenesis protein CcsA [Thermoanaerobaculia bacterium]
MHDMTVGASPLSFGRALPGIILLAIAGYFGFVVALAEYHGTALSFGLPTGAQAAIAAILGVVGAMYFLIADRVDSGPSFAYGIIALGVVCLLLGSYYGLFVAPPETYMGEVQRIMYVHVPTAWNALLGLTFAFLCALVFLFRAGWQWDARLEASIEVSVLLAFLLCCQGAIWAKPTWGVWWDWDPRLTTTAVLLFAFLGVLALRRFVDDPMKRAIWSSVATIIAYVDVPIVYYSVKWWNSLHQQPSNPGSVSKQFYLPLRMNAFGILFLMTGFIMLRARIARLRVQREIAPPPLTESEAGEEIEAVGEAV